MLFLTLNYVGVKAKFRSGSGPDPHLVMKLDPDPRKNSKILVRFGSIATSAIDLTDNLMICER